MEYKSISPLHEPEDVRKRPQCVNFEERMLKIANPTVNPIFVFFSAALSTYALSIMAEDVFNDCQATIIVGYIMRWLALAIAYVYLVLTLLLSAKIEEMSFLHHMKFYISPQSLLNILTILAVLGGSISFLFKAINSCGDYDYEGRDPSCCNEYLSNSSEISDRLPVGFFVNIALLFFMQVVALVDQFWVITLCWVAIIFSVAIPRIINDSPIWDDDVFVLIIFVVTSIIYAVKCQRNLTKAIKLIQAENEANIMEIRMNDMRLLMGNISHDLRTPMQAFSMELNSLERAIKTQLKSMEKTNDQVTGDADNCNSSVQVLKDTCSFMNATISRCLDYCKATVGIELCPLHESVHLEEALCWVVNCVNRTQEGKVQVMMDTIPLEIASHINTDKKWLEENLLCLVSNAVKFQMEGTVTVRCTIACQTDTQRTDTENYHDITENCSRCTSGALDSFLRFEVDDAGIGINESNRKSLFDACSSDRNIVGGTGLGLFSLSKRVEALGGDVGVETQKKSGERGCLFWFTIPYIPEVSIIRNQPAASKKSVQSVINSLLQSSPSSSPSRFHLNINSSRIHVADSLPDGVISNMKVTMADPQLLPEKRVEVLLVEDSIIIQKTTKRTFGAWGVHVEIAANGLLGLHELMKKRYDVVLMDMQMPVMGGAEATKRLRKHEENENIPTANRQLIVGISANCDDETKDLALESGMDAFVQKPFSIEDLKALFKEFTLEISIF